ncbi:MAG: hypothetical protein ACLQVD_17880 [Capsulimonadaceae bacterium]
MLLNFPRKKVLTILTTAVAVVCACGMMRAGAATEPNAYDDYVAAARLMVDTARIDQAVLPNSTIAGADEAALASENAAALARLRTGLSHAYSNPHVDTLADATPYYAKFLELGRLLVVAGDAVGKRGQWDPAAADYLDAIKLGEDIQHGSPLAGTVYGIEIEAMARRALWLPALRMESASALAAAARMAEIQAGHCRYVDTLQVEKGVWGRTITALAADPKWPANVSAYFKQHSTPPDDVTGGLIPAAPEKALDPAKLASLSVTDLTRSADSYFDHLIAMSAAPYTPDVTVAAPADPLNAYYAQGARFAKARVLSMASETENSLLLVALALRAYNEDNDHTYPDSLDSLVPKYLPRIPEDLFAAGAPLKYRTDTPRFLVWSVGPDGVDDNATPIDNANAAGAGSTMSTAQRLKVLPESRGDIVAGVNFY